MNGRKGGTMSKNGRFAEKVMIVTGGARGIGAATAIRTTVWFPVDACK